jgi:hypothetical protein
MLHMFHRYCKSMLHAPMISAVSVLRCSKRFHVASCKCFMSMLHMFHTYVSSICSKYFICFRRILHSSVFMLQMFIVQRYIQRVMGHLRSYGRGRARSHPDSRASPRVERGERCRWEGVVGATTRVGCAGVRMSTR